MKESTTRVVEIDMLKGIAILLVVAAHFLYLGDRIDEALYCYVNLLFFFVIGYTYRSGKKPLDNLKKRFIQILVPYFEYALCLSVLEALITHAGFKEYFHGLVSFLATKPTLNLIMPGYYNPGVFTFFPAPYWFLRILLIASTVFFFLIDWVIVDRKRTTTTLAILLCLGAGLTSIGIALPFNMQCVPSITAVMIFGAWMKKENIIEIITYESDFKKIILIILGYLICGVVGLMFPSVSLLGIEGTYGNPPWLTSFANPVFVFVPGSMACLLLCTYMRKLKLLESFLSWLGKNTFTVLLIHVFAGINFCRVTGLYCKIKDWSRHEVSDTSIFQSIIVFIATVLICIIWCKCLEIFKSSNK